MNENLMPMPTPEQAFEQYRPLVENNDQAVPVLLFAGSEQTGVAMLEVDAHHGLQPVLGVALPEMAKALGTPSWILLSIEAYVQTVESTDLSKFRPGALNDLAAAGDTTVRDAVQISGVAANGQRWGYMRMFTRTEHGVTWDEPSITHEDSGGVIDMLLHAVR